MAKEKLIIPLDCFYKIVAIASPLKGYRVSFLLNEVLNISLKKVKDLKIDDTKKETFSNFEQQIDVNSENRFSYFLINNKNANKRLLNNLKHFDYILVIHSDDDSIDLNEIFINIKSIKSLKVIIKVNELSSKNNKIVQNNILQQDIEKLQINPLDEYRN